MKNRLYFIDALRGLAILLMLEGHFIDALLAPKYRDTTSGLYSAWAYVRGNTAPLFFTIAGLVFTYLILISRHEEARKLRLKKGIKRGVQLILIGYLLRFSIHGILEGEIRPYTITIDVLHVMGAGILLLTSFMWLMKRKLNLIFSLSSFFCLLIFLIDPIVRTLELTETPAVIANWLVKTNGSVFTLLPWIGYLFAGSSIACLLKLSTTSERRKKWLCGTFAGLGIVLVLKSSMIFSDLGHLASVQLLHDIANYNWLFPRLGVVLILIAVLYLLERWIQFDWIGKIGRNTLGIYVAHFVILYGTFTGLGLYRFFSKSLDLLQIVSGVFPFMILSVLLGSIDYNSVIERIMRPLVSLKIKQFNRTYN